LPFCDWDFTVTVSPSFKSSRVIFLPSRVMAVHPSLKRKRRLFAYASGSDGEHHYKDRKGNSDAGGSSAFLAALAPST
jgi:hypothetical protein